SLEEGEISFSSFYPSDGPSIKDNFIHLGTSNDEEELATIRIKFVLAEDNPEEAAAKKADLPL
ncbi:MAG: hypothetical protein Q7K11_00225, partial [Candidatus Berkelbacteria bacterium]|nr:hypothetical protein [Candidatus Berkelbacteria bacterium]